MDSDYARVGHKIVLPYMIIELVAEDVLRFNLTKDTNIDMAKTTEMFEICKRFFPNRAYKSLKIVNYHMKIDKDVMDFLASDERKGLISMEAVVVNSAALKFLGNFYLKVKRPKIKTKVFDNEGEALNWFEKCDSLILNRNEEFK